MIGALLVFHFQFRKDVAAQSDVIVETVADFEDKNTKVIIEKLLLQTL
jgi:hypothetical protein